MPRLFVITGLVALAVLSRFIPHPPNFTAVGAIALFAGLSITDRRVAYGLPLVVMFLSDCVLGFHSVVPFVYVGMLCYVMLGRLCQRGNRVADLPLPKIAGATLLGSIAFFVITNLGAWWAFYEHSVTGLTACFVAAIPFFQWTISGDLIFATALLAALALAEQSKLMPATAPAV
ncbi:MAG: DUF6580 family putative transport protein [Planctomycetota bacterium]